MYILINLNDMFMVILSMLDDVLICCIGFLDYVFNCVDMHVGLIGISMVGLVMFIVLS